VILVKPPAKQQQNGAGQIKNTGALGTIPKKYGVTYFENVANES
jgi:hypothetical protein